MKLAKALRSLLPATATLALLGCSTVDAPPMAEAPIAEVEASAPEAASLDALLASIDIPHETFTLDNGLQVIIHTDRKSPLVGVTTYYRVGSKHEPRGRTGFAHLFEHLMFGGSENVENFDIPLEAAGSTSTNGSTWYDRTNYVETVPTGALDLALMMESDRMGYLLGAVSQEKLDNQRMVVQNEKRQGDNNPYGLTGYVMNEELLPVGHPYRHSTIGSMADLSAASLEDVQTWFRDNYAPNNVVLALTGDIDAETARPIVERWFGNIPRGAEVEQLEAGPVTLAEPAYREITDQVPATRIYQSWTGPGMTHPDAVPLQVGMTILGGLNSSRLDNAMVRGEESAVGVFANAQQHEQLSFLQTIVTVKDGVDRETAQAQLEAETARMIAEGPTQDEINRAVTQFASGFIGGQQRVGGFGGKGMILAEGLMYTGDAGFYRTQLEQMAAVTPESVRAAMERWLSRPEVTLVVVPGERTLDGGEMGGWGDEHLNPPPEPDTGSDIEVARTGPERELPTPAPVGALTFPDVERATLSNGIEVVLARRDAVPQLNLAMVFDAGSAVDPIGQAGVHETMIDVMTQGTTSRSALDIAIAQEALGASLGASAGVERSTVSLTALSANLEPSLELMADVVRNPAFAEADVARVRAQRVAAIEQQLSSPSGMASRALMPLIYGEDHPYSYASSAGDADVVAELTAADLAVEHAEWFRPDLATITAVGDVSMEELVAALEASFGDWAVPATPAPVKSIDAEIPAPSVRLVVVDRPNSPSSFLSIGRITPFEGHVDGFEAVALANEVIGSGFLSRLNSDLRETRGWTYGIGSSIPSAEGPRRLQIGTQVQADRTADSITVILDQMSAFPAANPVNDVEYQRVTDGNIRNLPNRFETNGQVLGALLSNQQLGRDLRYQASLPDLYRAVSRDAINAAAATYLQPDDLIIVVVGDRSVIDSQLEGLDMDIEYLSVDDL
ncbi:M16 family metallopeptidase [Aurantiacibacter sp. D1-12]|uniref:M16 family metallopeptidase n=1 Tax=Aurantiacibacter sp. D1-12 TaxID=2993658 RepID=UPI00237D1774|nr:pitrilysin family protein [Aurantiacibacter sp. D1-12]MDE1467028.1 pitrilysin family protein [Aurantiacibacter sp. D1-12]